jgi:alkaline phosphatase D
MKKNYLLCLFLASPILSCTLFTQNKVLIGSLKSNSINSVNKPYVLLISIDGYRWDYTAKYKPKFLSSFINSGVSLKSLRPSYPTKTYPNHLSIITGKYPMNHGIIANSFYDPKLGLGYSLSDRDTVKNGLFYQGKPFWALTNENQMRSATMFWPASEAKINGHRPSYYIDYEHNKPHKERVQAVRDWFNLSAELRPHFVSLYFSDVDSAGHRYGPDSHEVANAIEKVDKSISELIASLNILKIDLNIIIVSDHGMAALNPKQIESIAKHNYSKKILSNFKVIGKGPVIQLYRNKSSTTNIENTKRVLNKGSKHYTCYENFEIPSKLNFRTNKRIGDLACIAEKGWSIYYKSIYSPSGGHGWSQFEGMDMHGILYASGPAFKSNFELETQDNVHIYPLMAHILDLSVVGEIDGDLKYLAPLLK